jgi:hypothetical protein
MKSIQLGGIYDRSAICTTGSTTRAGHALRRRAIEPRIDESRVVLASLSRSGPPVSAEPKGIDVSNTSIKLGGTASKALLVPIG